MRNHDPYDMPPVFTGQAPRLPHDYIGYDSPDLRPVNAQRTVASAAAKVSEQRMRELAQRCQDVRPMEDDPATMDMTMRTAVEPEPEREQGHWLTAACFALALVLGIVAIKYGGEISGLMKPHQAVAEVAP